MHVAQPVTAQFKGIEKGYSRGKGETQCIKEFELELHKWQYAEGCLFCQKADLSFDPGDDVGLITNKQFIKGIQVGVIVGNHDGWIFNNGFRHGKSLVGNPWIEPAAK